MLIHHNSYLIRKSPHFQCLWLLGLYIGAQNSCNVEKIVVCFGITMLDCEAMHFIWEMTGENIFQAVLLEVSNEFSNLLKELSYEKAN